MPFRITGRPPPGLQDRPGMGAEQDEEERTGAAANCAGL